MVEPTTAPPGLEVSFDGSASTDDGAVQVYLFEYGDGVESGWQTASRSTHAYAVQGQYLSQLTVKDDRGTISSNLATSMVTITSQGYRPQAFIESVSPVPARAGETVAMHGHGVAAEGARVTAHSWNSSLDGHLGDAADITVDRLTVGSHTIIYKVQDDRGLWSEPATVDLDILPAEGEWTVAFTSPSEGAAIEHERVVVRGVASYTAGAVEYVEYRVDNNGWARADGTGTWSFELDASPLSDGYHTLRARAHALGTTSDIAFLNLTVDADGDGQGSSGGLAGMLADGWSAAVIAVVVIVAVVVVAAALVARSRRARRRARPLRISAGASAR
jgi:PKD repeat protein